MDIHEKEALLQYIEFQLINYCEALFDHVDMDAAYYVYDGAYQLLEDLEVTLQTSIELNAPHPKSKSG